MNFQQNVCYSTGEELHIAVVGPTKYHDFDHKTESLFNALPFRAPRAVTGKLLPVLLLELSIQVCTWTGGLFHILVHLSRYKINRCLDDRIFFFFF